MNIYLVERTDKIGYDEYDSHVVVAETELFARLLVAEKAADEGEDIWLAESTRVSEISATPSRIVLSSFNTG